jgi:hypothetical protein
MTDNEIINAKSQEIKRLRSVCETKDYMIQLAIDELMKVKYDRANESDFPNIEIIDKLKNAIG